MNLIRKAWKNKKQIVEGLTNTIFHKPALDTIISQRLQQCRNCNFYSENAKKTGYKTRRPDIHCINCGCNIELKTSCMSCSCPLSPPKWESIPSQLPSAGDKEKDHE